MEVTLKTLIIICPLVFLAGLVDSIAGGGGIISLPSYLFAGLPIHFAYGTNKFSSTAGTFFSTARFIKSGQVYYKSALPSVCGALVGSFAGAKAALFLDDRYLRYCLMVMLPVMAVFILTRRGFGEKSSNMAMPPWKVVLLSLFIGLLIGFYDGFLGPGAGALLVFVYTTVLGFNLTVASGNAKIVNLSSNISALTAFMAGGKVLFMVAVPAAFFGILGNWIGSGLAIKNGARIIRPVFIVVLVLLFIKIGIDLIM